MPPGCSTSSTSWLSEIYILIVSAVTHILHRKVWNNVWLVITTHADDNRGDLFINPKESAKLEHVCYRIFAVTAGTFAHANKSVVLLQCGDRADEGLLVHQK
jgi:hypothetical protein